MEDQIDLWEILEQHRLWIETQGEEGERAFRFELDFTRMIRTKKVVSKTTYIPTDIPDMDDEITRYRSEQTTNRLTLDQAWIPKADFGKMHLRRSSFEKADLKGVGLAAGRLDKSSLREADLRQARITHTLSDYSDFGFANFEAASLRQTDFHKADMKEACFKNARLVRTGFSHTDLRNASFKSANLRLAKFENADLRGAKGLVVGQLLEARTLHETKLDDELRRAVEERKPVLFEKPTYGEEAES